LLPALSDAEFEAVLDDLKDALPDEVTAIVTTLLTTEVTSEQAVQVVSSVEVLAVISGEQAEQLFDAVDESALTVEEQIQIVEAIADAPTEVKEAFENEINIFGGEGFDEYVPVDSNVSVAVRRTIIAGTTVLVAMPPPSARRR
jgi:AMMECR1 domain-containing protein